MTGTDDPQLGGPSSCDLDDDSCVDDALGVETVVIQERGQWFVEIIVMFADSVVRKRIDICFFTKTRAELSARLIKRGAERELRGPLNG